jgi:hypothetical protein
VKKVNCCNKKNEKKINKLNLKQIVKNKMKREYINNITIKYEKLKRKVGNQEFESKLFQRM